MLGIAGNGLVFTGPELDRLTADALRALVKECNVFARASPENKLKIVRALQVGTGRGLGPSGLLIVGQREQNGRCNTQQQAWCSCSVLAVTSRPQCKKAPVIQG